MLYFDYSRKTPGGVFFSLLKKQATSEQVREIFKVEKQVQKNMKRRRKRNETEGTGGGGKVDMPREVTDRTRTGVFSRLGVAQTQCQGSEVKDDQNDFSELGVALDQSPEVEGDPVFISQLGMAQTQGQSSEAEGDRTRTNVFSRLGIRQMQGQSPEVTEEGQHAEGTWQTGNVQGVWQEEEHMEVDTVIKSRGEGDAAVEGRDVMRDIWEREKAAALEFEDNDDSGVEFPVHLSID